MQKLSGKALITLGLASTMILGSSLVFSVEANALSDADRILISRKFDDDDDFRKRFDDDDRDSFRRERRRRRKRLRRRRRIRRSFDRNYRCDDDDFDRRFNSRRAIFGF